MSRTLVMEPASEGKRARFTVRDGDWDTGRLVFECVKYGSVQSHVDEAVRMRWAHDADTVTVVTNFGGDFVRAAFQRMAPEVLLVTAVRSQARKSA